MRNTISLPNITISRDGVVLFATQFVQIWIDFSVANKSLYYMSPFQICQMSDFIYVNSQVFQRDF